MSPADEPRLKDGSSHACEGRLDVWGAKLVPHQNYLTGLHQTSVQCWTKVLRDRRFHLLSGPLCLTSDAAHRDTSGEFASHAIPLTPHAQETPCTAREAHAASDSLGRGEGAVPGREA